MVLRVTGKEIRSIPLEIKLGIHRITNWEWRHAHLDFLWGLAAIKRARMDRLSLQVWLWISSIKTTGWFCFVEKKTNRHANFWTSHRIQWTNIPGCSTSPDFIIISECSLLTLDLEVFGNWISFVGTDIFSDVKSQEVMVSFDYNFKKRWMRFSFRRKESKFRQQNNCCK